MRATTDRGQGEFGSNREKTKTYLVRLRMQGLSGRHNRTICWILTR